MTGLTDLADWIEQQLADELASRQYIAEITLARIRELAAAPVVTAVLPNGSAVLTAADLVQLLGALEDAAVLLEDRAAQYCNECTGAPDEVCESHTADVSAAAEYRAVASRLDGGS